MKAYDAELSMKLDGTMYLTARIDRESKQDAQNAVLALSGKPIRLDMKVWKDRRSVDANSYFWTLCDKLADKMRLSSEEVYKMMIRDYGVREYLSVKTEAVGALSRAIRQKGRLGSFLDVVDEANGYSWVALYDGSSDYDTAEFSRLLDGIIEECKAQGIETLTPDEKALMIARIARL